MLDASSAHRSPPAVITDDKDRSFVACEFRCVVGDSFILHSQNYWSGIQDLNLGSLGPKPSALGQTSLIPDIAARIALLRRRCRGILCEIEVVNLLTAIIAEVTRFVRRGASRLST